MLDSNIKKIITSLFNLEYFFRPYINSLIASMRDKCYLNTTKRETPIVISLSASREDFGLLPITIYSLLQQELKADKIILWLDNEYEDLTNIPYEITQLIKNGLEIRFVNNFNNYTNTIEPLKHFKSSINIIAEENIYYPQTWLKNLYISYVSHPEDIHTHQANKIEQIENKIIINEPLKSENASFKAMFNIKSGVLYPPDCFTKEALRSDIYLKYCPHNPTLWFWAMALIHDRKIRLVKKHIKKFSIINTLENYFLKKTNSNNFDNEAKNLFVLYGNNLKKHL